jgi:prepilin-type N-terminal cleavage/methylation domain-containing protein
MLKKQRGFTLIELLVVIAIIGLLASIILASLDQARKKGRDARRIADVKEVQLALELYYDANSGYPSSAGGNLSLISSALTPTDISVLPTDPTNSGSYIYSYYSGTSGGAAACTSGVCASYLLIADTENTPPTGGFVGTWNGQTCATGSGPYEYCVHN